MFYKRPSLRRGGMPTGIDTLSPRVQANSGFFGTSQIRPMSSITGDFGRYNVGLSGGKLPFQKRMMKSFPMDASEMGVASIFKPTKTTNTTNDLDNFISNSLDSDFSVTETVTLPDGKKIQAYAEPQPSAKVLANLPRFMGGVSRYTDEYKDMVEKEKEIEGNLQKNKNSGFLPNAGPKQVNFDDVANNVVTNKNEIKSKDTQVGGDVVEDSFDKDFNTMAKRIEKYLGDNKDETKGKVALALSDAIGTEGTIADKAAALNKSLLGIATTKKKDKRDIAKLAFAAATELEGKRIDAGKLTSREKTINRYVTLTNKNNLSNSEKSELKALEGALRVDDGKLSTSSGINYASAIDEIKKKIRQFNDPTTQDDDKIIIRDQIKSVISGLNKSGFDDKEILSELSDYPVVTQFFNQGGRVNKAIGGGASETPAEPVATNLTFEQLRTRLPKEITDDVVKLVATSEEALQDFAYIRTQGDVEKFNVKYGVNLVLPQNTA